MVQRVVVLLAMMFVFIGCGNNNVLLWGGILISILCLVSFAFVILVKRVVVRVPSLIEAMRDQDSEVRIHAAIALAEIGKDAVPFLIEVLQDQDPEVRAHAVAALKQIGTPKALKAISDVE